MSISKRVSIAWNGGQAYEDTDTLVLTGHKYFVDVRIKQDQGSPLDWALTGIRTSVPGKHQGESECTWERIIDSRSSESTPVVDRGVNYTDNTDPLRVSERGHMLNPATGCVEAYEEIWLDEVIPPGTLVAFFEREDGSAFVGVIGAKKLGVGKAFTWRMEGDQVIFLLGEGEGMNLPLDITGLDGEKSGNWIVREMWRTDTD